MITQRYQTFPATPIDATVSQRVSELIATGSDDIYRLVLEPLEEEVIRQVVEHCRGNHCHASRLLGISRVTLRKKLKRSMPRIAKQLLAQMSGLRRAPET